MIDLSSICKGVAMDKDKFLKEYGITWEKMFKLCFNIPEVSEYLKIGWCEVYTTIIVDGWDKTPELWKMLAWHGVCDYLNKLNHNERVDIGLFN